MEIKKDSDQTVGIFMSSDDLSLFGLTYHQIDYGNCLTKLMIDRLMSFCQSVFSKKYTGSKVLIEVFPAPKGGCVIYFTHLCKENESEQRKGFAAKKYRVIKQNDFVIFRFENSDDLLRGVTAAKKSFRQRLDSELFLFKNKYYLLVKEHMSQRQKNILCEFAKKEKDAALMEPMLKEHAKLMLSPF